MVVAPAYLLHLKLSAFLPWFSFGLAEYAFQGAVLLILMVLMKKGKLSYLLSFVTTVLYGLALDASMLLTAILPTDTLLSRLLTYIPGVLLCAAGISLLFRTYLPPEAYELFVKELSGKLNKSVPAIKTAYDCGSLLLAVILSYAFFGKMMGIGPGTVVCALANGILIRLFTGIFDRFFRFRDRSSLRNYFEEREETL